MTGHPDAPRRRRGSGSRRSPLVRGLVAGAAGTSALHATTYLDMALRRRPASTTPEQTVDRAAALLGVPLPDDPRRRRVVLTWAGAALGVAAGVSAGVALAALRPEPRPGDLPGTAGLAWVLSMTVGNAPMTLLGVTDPRHWTATDWAADLVPHAAYAVAAAVTLRSLGT